MFLYLPADLQVFKNLALWVALVYDLRSNNLQYNNAQFMHNLYLFLCIPSFIHKLAIYLSLHDIIRLMMRDTVYIPTQGLYEIGS